MSDIAWLQIVTALWTGIGLLGIGLAIYFLVDARHDLAVLGRTDDDEALRILIYREIRLASYGLVTCTLGVAVVVDVLLLGLFPHGAEVTFWTTVLNRALILGMELSVVVSLASAIRDKRRALALKRQELTGVRS